MSREGKEKPFHFRQFSLNHRRSTMPVGTDAVLLGAWADLNGCHDVLDIGTGCGVIALILAQRSKARVTGIDIHGPSIEEARENAMSSPWSERISLLHTSLQEHAASSRGQYDLVVSNPPYFSGDLRSHGTRRNMARHADSLDPLSLVTLSVPMLRPGGRIAMILPHRTFSALSYASLPGGVTITRVTRVIPREGAETTLFLVMIGPDRLERRIEDNLILRDNDGLPSHAYRELTADLYMHLS